MRIIGEVVTVRLLAGVQQHDLLLLSPAGDIEVMT